MTEIFAYLGEMLTYPFMQRAFLAGILISVCASLLGVSLVLKRYSMIGDGLSHVGFGALAAAAILLVIGPILKWLLENTGGEVVKPVVRRGAGRRTSGRR